MFSFSYKNRIAFYYIVSTALLISLVFFAIYQIINYSVNQHIDANIQQEVQKHLEEIEIDSNNTYLIQVDQWRAREHNTANVNPVFVQFFDQNNKLIDKSPNLKRIELTLYDSIFDNKFVDYYLNSTPIRQIQAPLFDGKKRVGYLFVAMSLDDATMILTNLRNTLLVTFPIILIVLFLTARLIAGRSIRPVQIITETSSRITKDNLSERISLPQNKDELYVLSKTINDLLNSIENAVEREKQFTSDASHELRTPLAVLKGTLEVLVRKPRNQTEYVEKISYCIKEVDRLNNLVDELLLLARFENQKKNIKNEPVYLNALILDTLTRFSEKIKLKKITIKHVLEDDFYVNSDNYLVAIVLSNILSNALKYSHDGGEVTISLSALGDNIICKITDEGVGIPKEDFEKVFNPFYRSEAINRPEIKGTGLGLSIVKRLCDLLKIQIKMEPNKEKGITFSLVIKKE